MLFGFWLLSNILAGFAEGHIREELIDSDVVGFDETGMRVNYNLMSEKINERFQQWITMQTR